VVRCRFFLSSLDAYWYCSGPVYQQYLNPISWSLAIPGVGLYVGTFNNVQVNDVTIRMRMRRDDDYPGQDPPIATYDNTAMSLLDARTATPVVSADLFPPAFTW